MERSLPQYLAVLAFAFGFSFMQLAGAVVINDPAFSSVAFADDDDDQGHGVLSMPIL